MSLYEALWEICRKTDAPSRHVYLSSLLQAVIALHALVDTKTTIGKAELEGEKEKMNKEKEKLETKDSEESKLRVKTCTMLSCLGQSVCFIFFISSFILTYKLLDIYLNY